jgi:hypothetical protein
LLARTSGFDVIHFPHFFGDCDVFAAIVRVKLRAARADHFSSAATKLGACALARPLQLNPLRGPWDFEVKLT